MRAKQATTTVTPTLRFPDFRGASGWRRESLGSVLSSEASSVALNKLLLQASGHPVYGADGVVGHIDCYVQRDRYIAIVKDGSGVGRLALLPEKSTILGTLAYLKTRDETQASLDWLFHALTTVNFQKYVKGSGIPHIYFSDYSNEMIGVPALAEQNKIADCLTSLDEVTAAQARKVEALKAHKRGLMQQLFPRESETRPRVRFPYQSDWTTEGLPEVTFFQEGPGIMAVDFRDKGVPLVRLAGVGGVAVTLAGCNHLDPEMVAKKWQQFRLAVNDLVISTSATFGRSSSVTDVAAGAVFYTGLIRFRSIDERLIRSYLKVFLESPHFLRQAEMAAEGGGIKHFGPTHLKKMEICLPPLHEQRRIADCFSSVDTQIANETEQLYTLKNHKQGLMRQLFPEQSEVAR